MAIDFTFYGDLEEANDYFDMRLHEEAWTKASPADRPRALWAATVIINALNFKGTKHAVWEVMQSSSYTDADIMAAESTQALEFPRGADEEIPEAIRVACYELAHTLLDGKDPERELENLGIVSHSLTGISNITYNREQVPIEHIINGIPSAQAWRLIRPFLRDDEAISLSRVS